VKNDFLKGFSVRGADGKNFSRIPPTLKKMIEFLDALPFKELTTSIGLARSIDVTMDCVHKYACWPELAENKFQRSKIGGNLWGSKRTIKELKKQLAKQEAE
jgi:hypothetical protein